MCDWQNEMRSARNTVGLVSAQLRFALLCFHHLDNRILTLSSSPQLRDRDHPQPHPPNRFSGARHFLQLRTQPIRLHHPDSSPSNLPHTIRSHARALAASEPYIAPSWPPH